MAAVETSAGRGRGPQEPCHRDGCEILQQLVPWVISFYRDVEKDGKLLGKSIYTWIQTVGIFHIYVSLEEGKYW